MEANSDDLRTDQTEEAEGQGKTNRDILDFQNQKKAQDARRIERESLVFG